MNRKIKIGVVCRENPIDRHPQSGTIFHVFKTLRGQEGLDVYWIPFYENIWSRIWIFTQKILNKVFGISMPFERSIFYIKLKEKAIDKRLIQQADVLFCPFTQLVSIDKPTVYMSDAVFQSMINYYWKLDANSREAILGNRTQQAVLEHASRIVLPSQWAIDCATSFYNQPLEKITLAEYGPNIDETDIALKEFFFEGHLHILFLGVDWERKGGDIAVDACRWLNDNGVKSTIHIVGPRSLDNDVISLSYVDYVGFLNKNERAHYEHLLSVIYQCHCMLLPTKAECAGIAFCESSAYGLPSFSYYTGGIPNYVIEGKNGYLLPLGSTGEDFGEKIKGCLNSGELECMSRTSLEVFHTILNWDTWGKKMVQIINELMEEIK